MIIIDMLLLNTIMIMDTIRKDSSMIINIQIKEKVVTKGFHLIIFQGINTMIDKKEVEAEVEVIEVGVVVEVEVGVEEVAIVDIEIGIS